MIDCDPVDNVVRRGGNCATWRCDDVGVRRSTNGIGRGGAGAFTGPDQAALPVFMIEDRGCSKLQKCKAREDGCRAGIPVREDALDQIVQSSDIADDGRVDLVTQIYKITGSLRAAQLPLGHTKLDSTVRYLGVELEDALAIAKAIEI